MITPDFDLSNRKSKKKEISNNTHVEHSVSVQRVWLCILYRTTLLNHTIDKKILFRLKLTMFTQVLNEKSYFSVLNHLYWLLTRRIGKPCLHVEVEKGRSIFNFFSLSTQLYTTLTSHPLQKFLDKHRYRSNSRLPTSVTSVYSSICLWTHTPKFCTV